MLKSHPRICTAKGTKETEYFDKNYEKDLEWYERFFGHCGKCKVRGEVSNSYFYTSRVPRRIRECVPNAKLITCLRDPVERMKSIYFYQKSIGNIQVDFKKAIEDNEYLLDYNKYKKHLKRYLDHFKFENLKILFYQDFKENPEMFSDDILEFLGLSVSGVDPCLFDSKINASAEPRHWVLGRVASKVANLLRYTGNYELLHWLKRNDLMRGLVLKELSSEEMEVISNGMYKHLIDIFEPHIRYVEDITGRSLSKWRKPK